MKYTILGKSGLEVSRIAFGTWQLGGDWGTDGHGAGDRRHSAGRRKGRHLVRHRPGLWLRRV
jgi:aryl-alcohol dehydrogenase-like predicted oxidoreductase